MVRPILVLQRLGTLESFKESMALGQVKLSLLMLMKPFHALELGLGTDLKVKVSTEATVELTEAAA